MLIATSGCAAVTHVLFGRDGVPVTAWQVVSAEVLFHIYVAYARGFGEDEFAECFNIAFYCAYSNGGN